MYQVGQDIGLDLKPGSHVPLYRQIFDEIASRIRARTFPPGYRLPPSRVLAAQLGAHRNTVARAYTDLEAAGFVRSTVGQGTFVEVGAAEIASKASEGERFAREDAAKSFPWSSLLSQNVRMGVLERAEKFARRSSQKSVVNLARMQPSVDLLPHDLIRRCIERVLASEGAAAMAYAPPEGVPRLREQIAHGLSARGVPARAEDLVITSGSQQGLDLLARALINPGDTILVDATTYSGAIDIFTLAGARLSPIPCDEEGPEISALERMVRPDVKALYLMPNSHNPTGRTISAARRQDLVRWSLASKIPIIEDDYGAGLALDNPKGDAFPALRALDGNVLYLSTFSKRLVPALRVGFVLCPPAIRQTLVSMKRVVDLGTSAIMQLALAEFMERGYLTAHMNRVVPEYRERRDALDAALHKHAPRGVSWHKPSHGVVMWLKLPPSISPEHAYEAALEHGVLVSPSPLWSVSPRSEGGVRLAFCGEPKERVALGAKRLGKALHDLAGRGPDHPESRSVLEIA